MPVECHTTELAGCRPVPVAHYLKALGILRIIAEQADSAAQGWWEGNRFLLRATLDRDALLEFFLNSYYPTPIVAPWNGGSGFFDGDNREAISAILSGAADRYESYRCVIAASQALLVSAKMDQKPEADEKQALLVACRSKLPDSALAWLDGAFVLTSGGAKYPPLLGTGGNDGRLEFTNNFMQRCCELFSPSNGEPVGNSENSLCDALFCATGQTRVRSPIGQFDPSGAGGANAEAGYDSASFVNAWDYVLTLEGAIAFAAGTVRKLDDLEPGIMAYPFCVQPSGVGYASADCADEALSRCEMWLPLWNSPATFPEIRALLSEGRVEVHRRRAQNGVDFARAIASLGVDRGIQSFERYGFQQRNGLAYFSISLGTFKVHDDPSLEELLASIDSWLRRFRRASTAKNAPSRGLREVRQIETAIMELCRHGEKRQVLQLLMALGAGEAALSKSRKLRDACAPIPSLPKEWVSAAYEQGDCEFRLAAALASLHHKEIGPLRRHITPVDTTGSWPKWAEPIDDPGLVWSGGNLVRNMIAVLRRRAIEAIQGGKQPGDKQLTFPGDGWVGASLGDIAAFIGGNVDDRRIERLLRGLVLVDWPKAGTLANRVLRGHEQPLPDAAYGLLKLCHLPFPIPLAGNAGEIPLPLVPQITNTVATGRLEDAVRLAVKRLRASGLPAAVEAVTCRGARRLRTAASLLFPLRKPDHWGYSDVGSLRDAVLQTHATANGNGVTA